VDITFAQIWGPERFATVGAGVSELIWIENIHGGAIMHQTCLRAPRYRLHCALSVARRREERLEVRLSKTAKNTLQQAAALQRKTISAFVLDSILAAAAETLANRREFPLSTKQYDAFVAALDAPPKHKPRLAKLLNTASVLEK
jgi:uncharacterized protein (DUF1778 family)